MASKNYFPQPICEQIWKDKYQLISPKREVKDDDTVEDTWKRIAKACAGATPELYEGGVVKTVSPSFQSTWE